MPTFLQGQQNLAALTVPGEYVEIIPPSPFLVGQPTNLVGVVGVASWGKPGAVIPVSNTIDGAVKIGQAQIRTHDMATYVAAASLVGGAAVFNCVRVTDGTDTAATASVQSGAIVLTAANTGVLGNQIQFVLSQGTSVGSFLASIAFPGATPEIFNNIGNGIGSVAVTPGSGYTSVPVVNVSFTFSQANNPNNAKPVVQATLAVSGATVVNGGTSGFVVNDLVNLTNGVVVKVLTAASGVIGTVSVLHAGSLTAGNIPTNPVTMLSTSGAGVGNPTFTLTWQLGPANIINPGSGLLTAVLTTTGGSPGTAGSYAAALSPWLNLANALNNGNATHGPSQFVVATAGTSNVTPVLGSAVVLSGGTDGASGVTDETLIGVDVFPLTGMFSLSSSGVAAFTLCDLSTPALWQTMDAFALAQNSLSCVSTISGDTIENAVATRLSVGLDDEWTWICVGDFPTFFDAANGVSRLVSPSAFQIGYVGNASPQLSPLNTVLRGISATQRTQSGQAYQDSDLQVANTGGVDLIIGPPTTLGGDYFTFATGLNASSNTAANGVNYTTMTNFLANTAQSKAAGSIIGQLQSIQANDPTRANAAALFNGFSNQLTNPLVGSNGIGIIDGFAVQCNLQNNPPALQALGYLFLFWQVRYLNTVRFFVVELQGGGNVTVSSQSTVPTVAQLLNTTATA
jgi:hypothetical protein